MKVKDLVGQRFGRLFVVARAGSYVEKKTGRKLCATWEVVCDCGRHVTRKTYRLTSGISESCGCLPKELAGQTNRLPNNGAARNLNLKHYKDSATKRGFVWALSDQQFDSITALNCHYCGIVPTQICRVAAVNGRKFFPQIVYNGIDRVDNTRGYAPDNVVPCCKVCNRAKDVMPLEEFLAWVGRVYAHRIARSAGVS